MTSNDGVALEETTFLTIGDGLESAPFQDYFEKALALVHELAYV